MRVLLRRNPLSVTLAVGLVGVLLAGCSSASPTPTPASTTLPPAEAGLVEVTVTVADDDLAARPFDEPRKALVPKGWTLSLWHRLPKPRLASVRPFRMKSSPQIVPPIARKALASGVAMPANSATEIRNDRPRRKSSRM